MLAMFVLLFYRLWTIYPGSAVWKAVVEVRTAAWEPVMAAQHVMQKPVTALQQLWQRAHVAGPLTPSQPMQQGSNPAAAAATV